MNKINIITQYNLFVAMFGIQREDFVLGAGGACLMLGLRETTDDMDMGLKQSLYEELRDSGNYEVSEFHGTHVVAFNSDIDLHPEEEGETIMIDGVCCWTAQRILDFKMKLNRPKDQKDIYKLKLYLEHGREHFFKYQKELTSIKMLAVSDSNKIDWSDAPMPTYENENPLPSMSNSDGSSTGVSLGQLLRDKARTVNVEAKDVTDRNFFDTCTSDAEIKSEQVEYDFKDKRADFEQFYGRISKAHDLTRAKDGGYMNQFTEMAWATYKHAILRTRTQMYGEFKTTAKVIREAALKKAQKPTIVQKSSKPYKREGPYFIGGYDEVNKEKGLRLGVKPKFYKDLEDAEKEAQRLANVNDGNYWIYGSTGIRYTKQSNVQVAYIVKGFLDQIEKDQYTASFNWIKDEQVPKLECNPTLVYLEFENKDAAIYLYKHMAMLKLARFKNWH